MKIIRTNYFRATQNLNHEVGFYVQSSELYRSSEKNVFIKISMGMILKYVEISVAVKVSVKFRGSIREIPRSKCTKNAIFDLFWFPIHKRLTAVELLNGFCWK